MMQVKEKPIKVKNEPSDSFKTDSKSKDNRKYVYLNRRKNLEYDQGIIRRSFESCLNTIKGSKKTEKKQKRNREYHIKTRPKWFTDFWECSLEYLAHQNQSLGLLPFESKHIAKLLLSMQLDQSDCIWSCAYYESLCPQMQAHCELYLRLREPESGVWA